MPAFPIWTSPAEHGRTLLQSIVGADQPPPFALLHRPRSTGAELEVLVGEVAHFDRLADLPVPDPAAAAEAGHDLVVLVPFRQITERGYDCLDDHEPILAISVTEQATVPLAEARSALPQRRLRLRDCGFDVEDAAYADLVRTIIRDEIGSGSGSNFVIQRAFTATIEDYSPQAALALFCNLLAGELGAYWTFIVHTGNRTLIGATPERHLSLEGDTVVMNPISGTLRYPPSGPVVADVLEFLDNAKETDELHMVLDEELKMMAAICRSGGLVVGPYLKEMARLAHTEYLIEGRTDLDIPTLLRETMFAPTVTGSPLENACRVIARHEPTPRGYYSGVVATIGRDHAGRSILDSSILIRTADIDPVGRLALRVGATIVRHSDPAAEVLETHAKAAGLLKAAGWHQPDPAVPSSAAPAAASPGVLTAGGFRTVPAVQRTLARRNDRLARFWLDRTWSLSLSDFRVSGSRVLVVDAEDTFTAMLGHQLRALGLRVTIAPYHRASAELAALAPGLVLLGPGPGDPNDLADRRIRSLRALAEQLLDGHQPFVAICLGHQVLATVLGLTVVRKALPSQGLQREIDLFGSHERVGFYNTYAALSVSTMVASDRVDTPFEVSRDEHSGEVHALRGHGFASLQFHPESVLTSQGPRILADLITWSLASRVLSAHG